MRKTGGGQIRANRLIGPPEVLAGDDSRVPAKGRDRTAPYGGRSGSSWIWSTPLDAGASEGELRSRLRPHSVPLASKNISLFYRKEDLEKSRLRGRLQLFFINPLCGDFQLSLREFYSSLITRG